MPVSALLDSWHRELHDEANRHMLSDGLQAMLILQERDVRRSQLEKALAQIPRERTAGEAKIVAHRASIEAAKKGVMELELRRKEIDNNLRSLADQVGRYKTQQMSVKKNDEYQALTHEIELADTKIGEAEEAEIKLLYELDAERARTKATEKELSDEIANENAQLGRLVEREKNVGQEVVAAQAEVGQARPSVPVSWLPRYDQLAKTVGLPVVVALQGQKCGGCHLKVSNGVETQARIGGDVATCDNCGRFLYFQT